MQVIKDIQALRDFTLEQQKSSLSIGWVPTMGALHQGHMSLIDHACRHSDVVLCTIYVNPFQFNNPSDLADYPRSLSQDLSALENTSCQAVFVPDDRMMYPQEPVVTMDFGTLGEVMEGTHRPGHFRGVGLVVAKLFNMVQPDHAYFGQKDWQQVVIIRQLVKDLSFAVDIKVVPIVREPDGLAMSSRNRLLTDKQRALAPELYRTLQEVGRQLEAGNSLADSRKLGMEYLRKFPEIRLEYLEVVDSGTLQAPRLPLGNRSLSICVAAYLGVIRLIDNVKVF